MQIKEELTTGSSDVDKMSNKGISTLFYNCIFTVNESSPR
jgi:hypothetical protein